jgi:WD40 repeat protein
MALSTNGKVLAVGNSLGMIHLWDIENGTRLLAIAGREDPVTALALSPDGSQVACAGHNRTVLLRKLGIGPVGGLNAGDRVINRLTQNGQDSP